MFKHEGGSCFCCVISLSGNELDSVEVILLHVIYLSVNRWQYCAKCLFLAVSVGHGLSQFYIIV